MRIKFLKFQCCFFRTCIFNSKYPYFDVLNILWVNIFYMIIILQIKYSISLCSLYDNKSINRIFRWWYFRRHENSYFIIPDFWKSNSEKYPVIFELFMQHHFVPAQVWDRINTIAQDTVESVMLLNENDEYSWKQY